MRFAPWTTSVYAALWLVVVAQGWGPLLDGDPMLRLHYPDSAAERLTSRDLELAEAIEHAPALERQVLGALYGTRDEALAVGIDTQREVLVGSREGSLEAREFPTDEVRARLAVLLSEAGRHGEAQDLLREDPTHQPLLELLAGSRGMTEEEARELLYAAGLFDWYADRVLLRAGAESSEGIRADLLERGSVWKRRSLAVLGANLLLVVCGVVLLATRIRSLPELLRGAGGAPPWTLEDGIGVFVRGDFWNRLFFLTLAWVWTQPFGEALSEHPIGTLLQTWGTLLASLPLLWLVHRHLLAPLGRSATRSFGLDVPMAAVLRVALCAISIDLLGTHALAWSAWGLGVSSSWAEGFDEMLVWGDGGEALFSAADYILWAPAMEELAFRGLLYYSLRHRLGPLTAAIVTAGFFAGLHFYSLPGFLMTLWSGLVWALAFERLRSLLPGIGAHAVYNGLFVAGLVLLYR